MNYTFNHRLSFIIKGEVKTIPIFVIPEFDKIPMKSMRDLETPRVLMGEEDYKKMEALKGDLRKILTFFDTFYALSSSTIDIVLKRGPIFFAICPN